VLGYRQAGERAVRVDILERLADLIRPALAWRESSPGDKPAGAFDGRSFVVTQAMTSLTGSAGEDFASILRALGYRMERRPPLPPKPVAVEAPAAEAAPAEAAVMEATAEAASADPPAETAAEAPVEITTEVVDQQITGDPAPSAALLPEVSPFASSEETRVVEAQPEVAAETEAPIEQEPATETAAEASGEAAPVAEVAPAAEATTETASAEAAPATPAEPAMVEVWRPGGRSEERRPRHERGGRHRHQGQGHGQAQRQDGAPDAEGQKPADGEKRERHRNHGRRDFRKPRDNAPAAPAEVAAAPAEGAPVSDQRQEQRPEQRREREGKGRDRDRDNKRETFGDRQGSRRDERDRGRDRDKGRDKRDRESGPALRHYASSQNPRERDRPVDPNSPFAKLAALKEQLAGNRKE
jgi:ATP-dependent RNA helicase SUPV3L1/SUV3